MKPPISFSFLQLFALLAVCLVINSGCKKNNTAPAYSFTYSGSRYAGGSVQFKGIAPAGDSLVWEFGDGDSSRIANPVHSYTAPGIYTVTLIASAHSRNTLVTNVVQIAVDSIFIPSLAGSRLWSFHTVATNCYFDTSYTGNASFGISVIDPFTIIVNGDTLMFSGGAIISPGDTEMSYAHNTSYDYRDYSTFSFSTSSDMLQYIQNSHTGACDNTNTTYITP